MASNTILPVTFEEGLSPDDPQTLAKMARLEEWLVEMEAELERALAVLRTARTKASDHPMPRALPQLGVIEGGGDA